MKRNGVGIPAKLKRPADNSSWLAIRQNLGLARREGSWLGDSGTVVDVPCWVSRLRGLLRTRDLVLPEDCDFEPSRHLRARTVLEIVVGSENVMESEIESEA